MENLVPARVGFSLTRATRGARRGDPWKGRPPTLFVRQTLNPHHVVDRLELASKYSPTCLRNGRSRWTSPPSALFVCLAFDHDPFDQIVLLLEAACAIRHVACGMKGYHLALTDGKDARTPSKATGKIGPIRENGALQIRWLERKQPATPQSLGLSRIMW